LHTPASPQLRETEEGKRERERERRGETEQEREGGEGYILTGVPPRVHDEDVISSGEVEGHSPCLERD
jgi:hypothetical protein